MTLTKVAPALQTCCVMSPLSKMIDICSSYESNRMLSGILHFFPESQARPKVEDKRHKIQLTLEQQGDWGMLPKRDQGIGPPTPHAVKNPYITFDSPKTLLKPTVD